MIKLLKKRIDEKIKLVLVLSGKKVYISPLLNIISITPLLEPAYHEQSLYS